MQRLFPLLLAALLPSSTAFAAEQPLISITLKSYRDLETGFKTIAEKILPGSAEDVLADFLSEMKIADMKGIDRARPWQAAVWLENSEKTPSVSFRIPVSDFADFRRSMQTAAEDIGIEVELPIELASGYAKVWIEGDSPAAKAWHEAWMPAQLDAPDKMLAVAICLPESLRQELLQGIGSVRMMIPIMFSQMPEEEIGINGEAMGELIGIYFDLIEMGLRDMETLEVSLNVDQNTVELGNKVTAKPGSELASWLRPVKTSLETVLPSLNPEVDLMFAMQFGDNPAMLPIFKKFIRLSFEMQGTDRNDPAIRDAEKLIDAGFPMMFSSSVDFDFTDGINFDGVYRFPGGDLDAFYRQFTEYMNGAMQSQVGPEKPYKTISLKKTDRQVDGAPVDRLLLEINWDAPIYQAVDQREILEALWLGGKFEFLIARKGEKLFMGTPAAFDGLMRRVSSDRPPSDIRSSAHTVACGKINVLKYFATILGLNLFASEDDIKLQLQNMDSDGTGVSFNIELNGAFQSQAVIPLKLISTLAEFIRRPASPPAGSF